MKKASLCLYTGTHGASEPWSVHCQQRASFAQPCEARLVMGAGSPSGPAHSRLRGAASPGSCRRGPRELAETVRFIQLCHSATIAR